MTADYLSRIGLCASCSTVSRKDYVEQLSRHVFGETEIGSLFIRRNAGGKPIYAKLDRECPHCYHLTWNSKPIERRTNPRNNCGQSCEENVNRITRCSCDGVNHGRKFLVADQNASKVVINRPESWGQIQLIAGILFRFFCAPPPANYWLTLRAYDKVVLDGALFMAVDDFQRYMTTSAE